ncbi:MAG TPA: type I restriction endonuclease subunit R [Solirubrobacterales bacterium]|nr:type I restriction endonuclease subunit R [Solirubrobacterales bacterium]
MCAQHSHGDSKEDFYAEQPTLQWLEELGWEVQHGPNLGPEGSAPERDSWRDVVLVDRLRSAVAGLNPELPEDGVEQVVQQALTTKSPNVIEDHADFHRLLVEQVPVTYEDGDGIARSDRAKLVDFEHPENNDFLALNQFTVIVGSKNRRPDVLLFVNGIPLGQIELKNPADEKATPLSAVTQVAHYAETIPPLYRFVEIVGVSDVIQARVGTITTPAEHFAQWKTMDPAEGAGKSELELMLAGAFAPERLLDLIHNFVLFEVDAGKTTKVLAKYHQVDAVNRAVAATAEAMQGDGRAGVVWHTQGAGKSYSMVFYAQKLRRDPRFENPTVVCVTDRIDLDDQLMQTFAKQAELAQSVKQADAIAEGSGSLRALLEVPAGGIVFTTIQKFVPPGGSAEMPALSERRNVIVVSDEAHRSQYADFARNLRKALPHATRIGFTGTPIETESKSTSLTFGDYISVYDITRAVEDGATVRIYYEGRIVPLDISDAELVAETEKLLQEEDEEAAGKLISAETRLDRVVGSAVRLDKVAADVAAHFRERQQLLEGKAMVVGMSREICVELTERLQQALGEKVVTCVITAKATEPKLNKYRRSKAEMKQVANDFKDPDHPLKVVVVRDMWLTGFDVPPLHTMYVDKPMRDHGLLQAIARVNRVFRDKPGGLVVDYIGIGEDLRKALPRYAAEDVKDAMTPLRQVISKLREKHEVVCEFFHGLEWSDRDRLDAAGRATLLAQAHAQVVEDEEETRRFLDEQSAFARLLALVNPEPAVEELLDDAEFFAEVAASVRKYTPPEGEPSEAARQAVKQVFSAGLGAGEVTDVLGLPGNERLEVSILSEEFLDDLQRKMAEPPLTVAFLKKLLGDEIRSRGRRNQMQAKLFGDELEAALARYRNRQITGAEVVKALVELAKKVRDARHRHQELGLGEEEAAFYDALVGSAEELAADPKVAEIARDLVRGIRADLSVDWTSHENREALIRRKVKRLLRKHHYRPPAKGRSGGGGRMTLERATALILDQARVLYYKWPEVDNPDLP